MVVGFLRPADQQPAETIEPGVGSFDYPAARAEASGGFELFLFLAAGADVRGEPVLAGQREDLGVVVALVEADPLWLPRRGVWPLDQDAFERRAEELEVVDVRSRDLEPDRDATAVADDRALRPFFARSVGFGPVFSPPSGALPLAPSQESQAHSIPFSSSYASSPCRQNASNTPALAHSWKRRCAELDVQIPVQLSAFHCIPVRATSRIASIASRSGTRGL